MDLRAQRGVWKTHQEVSFSLRELAKRIEFARTACHVAVVRYLGLHHCVLDVESKAFKMALESGVAKGQLRRLTGKGGMAGTFQLVDGARKTGTRWENAIENAVIAMNEPKDASVRAMLHYLSEYHTEYKVAENPKVLLRALDRAEKMGRIKRVTGTTGLTGSYRLSQPYHPNPKDLWGDWYERDETEGHAADAAHGYQKRVGNNIKRNKGKAVRMSASNQGPGRKG